MKVVYNFIYSDSEGKIQEFKMPVGITEDIDTDTMYDLCLSYLEVGKVKGTPLHAISTSGKYPNYCFTSTACDSECEACRSKKLKKYFGDKASITQMDYFDDVVSSLAVIL